MNLGTYYASMLKMISIIQVAFFLSCAQAAREEITVTSYGKLKSAVKAAGSTPTTIFVLNGLQTAASTGSVVEVSSFQDIAVIGTGDTPQILDVQGGNPIADRRSHFLNHGTLALVNLKLINGYIMQNGGAVYSRGNTTIENSSFEGNTALYGQDIYHDGDKLLLRNVRFLTEQVYERVRVKCFSSSYSCLSSCDAPGACFGETVSVCTDHSNSGQQYGVGCECKSGYVYNQWGQCKLDVSN